ncbi:MAG: nitroreductase family protein [Bacillota bacterium]|nr:nitroreductase family protein [Bacillota bacterium]
MLNDLLKKRRSIRLFQDKKIEEEKIREILQAGLYAPSGMRRNPWEFVVLSDPEDMKKAALAKKDQPVFEDKGSHIILILTDHVASNTYIEDSAIVATIMQLKIAELGLGSCWVQLRQRSTPSIADSEAYLRKTFNIPDQFSICQMLVLGYPGEDKGEKEAASFEKKVHFNSYKQNEV